MVLLTAPIMGAGQSLFVDPVRGNDANSGRSMGKAFRTIVKAQNFVRTINKNMKRNIIVNLRGGLYTLDKPFELTAEDGGSNGNLVIYQSYHCEKPVISGGVKLTDWVLHDPQKNIYRTAVDKDLDSRQLYVNAIRATRARSIDAAGWYEDVEGYVCPPEVGTWGNISNIEVVSHAIWKCHRGSVSSVNGTHAKMAQPYWNNVHLQFSAPPVWIENAYELLDAEGEWYLDRKTATVYYKPRTGENLSTAEVIIASQEALLMGKGASNIEFKGITFAHATWLLPNSPEGFANHQADERITTLDWRGFQQMPGNIRLEHCTNISITSCVFTNLGSTAIQLSTGCKNNTIYNSTFTDVSGSGISVGPLNDSFPSSVDLVKDNTIKNNLITNVAVEYQGCVGILVGHTDHTVITHNELRNLPYTGISVGWGWSSTETVAKDNEVGHNLLDSVVTLLHDGGAIYTQSAQSGTEIHHNYIKNEINDHAALYLDQGSSFMHWHHNVLESIYRWIDLTPENCFEIIADHNYYNNEDYLFGGQNCVLENNVYFQNNEWPPEAVDIIKTAGRVPVNTCGVSNPNNSLVGSLGLYPNPTRSNIIVDIGRPLEDDYIVQVFDAKGALIKKLSMHKSEGQLQIDLSNNSSGLYLVRIVSGRTVLTGKAIKH